MIAFPRPRRSIGNLLIGAVGALTLIIILLAGGGMNDSARRLAQMRALQHVGAVTDQIFGATESLAQERDLALSALIARDSATRILLRQRMLQSRHEAIARFDAATAAMGAAAGIGDWRTHIEQHRASIRALRAKIDKALDAHLAAPDLAARWSQETSALIDDTEDLWLDFVRPYANVDPVVTQQLRYNHFLRTIYDYSGRERSLVGQILAAGQDATPAQIAGLLRGQGVLDLSWRTSFILARQSGLYDLIRPVYTDAKSHYDTLHGMLEGAFYAPGARGQGDFPIAADLWFELSDQYQDSLDTLRAASRAGMRAQVERLIAESQRAITGQAIILGLALVLAALSFWVVLRQVIGPINQIVAALVGAAQGAQVDFSQERKRDDEIGKLVDVLHAFQQKAEDVRQGAALLDRSERRLRAVVDNAVDGLITIDARGVVQSFNPACERIFGYAAVEVIGRNVSMLMPAPDRDEHDNYLARYAGSGEARVIGAAGRELMARRKDGSVFPIDLSISGIVLPEGSYFSGIIRDISLRKEAEWALARHARALERSNKELDDFAYIASHDLKEPLRGIHNHARFLLEDNAAKLDEDSVKRLGRLVYLSQRMEGLVNDLLYFSRLGRQDLAIQPTDFDAVVRDIEATLDQFLEERGARIVTGPLPTLICDRPRVTEALRNLVTNAAKYNDKTEKRIEIGFLQHARTPSGADVFDVIYVKDNGRGIDREFHQDIFRIFKRLQGGKGAEEGSGVGLTFVKKIIERHGGQIWVESEPGAGATFYFTLESNHDGDHTETAAAA